MVNEAYDQLTGDYTGTKKFLEEHEAIIMSVLGPNATTATAEFCEYLMAEWVRETDKECPDPRIRIAAF